MMSITIIIPCLNEELNLSDSVQTAILACKRCGITFEIIIINDGSYDKTLDVALKLKDNSSFIKVISHSINRGLGAAYKTGLSNARSDYVMLLPGDNAWNFEEITKIISCIGYADIIIPYIVSANDKNFLRKKISRLYTFLINFIFNLNIPYYNGVVIHKTKIIKSIEINADDFSYQTEALVKLLKRGYSFYAIPSVTSKRAYGKSRAFNLYNIIRVVISIIKLRIKF